VCVVHACYTTMWIMSSIVLRFDYILHTFSKYCSENNMILNYCNVLVFYKMIEYKNIF
jgi:hypothetical protein